MKKAIVCNKNKPISKNNQLQMSKLSDKLEIWEEQAVN